MNPGAIAAVRAREERGIPVGPFQDAFRRSGLSASELALRLGWTRTVYWRHRNGRTVRRVTPVRRGDASRVLRRLGLSPYWSHGQREKFQAYMTYEVAEVFCRALDLDPVDVGL